MKTFPAGLPAPFRPWMPNNNNHENGMNLQIRLKSTASADLLVITFICDYYTMTCGVIGELWGTLMGNN